MRPDAADATPCEDEDCCSYRALIDGLPELISRYTPDGTLTFVNASCAAFHGLEPDELVGHRLVDLVPEAYIAHTNDHLAAMRACTPDRPTRVNLTRAVEVDGTERWQEWTDTALFDDGAVVEVIGIGRDVTARIEAEERSRFHAEHDNLTGLLNRRMINEALDRLAERASRSDHHLGVLYIDIDGFKQVNDTLGHEAGDRVLVQVADALRVVTRVDDLVGRIGGDEFVVLVHPAEHEMLRQLADRLREAAQGLTPPVGLSIGVALSTLTTSPEALLRLADQSMYADKDARRRARRASQDL